MDIRLSFPKPIIDDIMSMFQMKPLRCRFCRHRFFRRLLSGPDGIGIPSETEPDRQG